MNNSPDAIVVLVDEKFNIVTIKDGSNTSFIKTKIELRDYPFDSNVEMAARNAIIRHLKDVYSLFVISNRLFNASLVDEHGNKTYLLIYKLDITERLTLQMSKNVAYVSISNLPQSLDLVSSTIAVAVTNYFDIFKKSPNPPGIFTVNYPVQVPIFVPVQPVTLLKPVMFFQPRQFPLAPPPPQQQKIQPPKLIHLSEFSSESEKSKIVKPVSEKQQPPKLIHLSEFSSESEKSKIVKPVSEKQPSPQVVKPVLEKQLSPQVVKPISEKKVSPKLERPISEKKSERDAINKVKGLEKQRTTPKSEIISDRKKRKSDKKSSKSSSASRKSSRRSSSSSAKSSSRRSLSAKSSSRRSSSSAKSSSRRNSSSAKSSSRRNSSSSVKSASSPKKSSSKSSTSRRNRKNKKKNNKGGYYDKYLKYKMKYLQLQRDFIDLQKKNL